MCIIRTRTKCSLHIRKHSRGVCILNHHRNCTQLAAECDKSIHVVNFNVIFSFAFFKQPFSFLVAFDFDITVCITGVRIPMNAINISSRRTYGFKNFVCLFEFLFFGQNTRKICFLLSSMHIFWPFYFTLWFFIATDECSQLKLTPFLRHFFAQKFPFLQASFCFACSMLWSQIEKR